MSAPHRLWRWLAARPFRSSLLVMVCFVVPGYVRQEQTIDRAQLRRRIVRVVEDACGWTHWFTWHRPWLWLGRGTGYLPVVGLCVHCPLAELSSRLDERWFPDGDGEWKTVTPAEPVTANSATATVTTRWD